MISKQLEQSYASKGDTVIKSDAWIGMNAMIMPGTTIGEGNPAKEIKKRFIDSEINKLMEIRWFAWERIKGRSYKSISHDL